MACSENGVQRCMSEGQEIIVEQKPDEEYIGDKSKNNKFLNFGSFLNILS